MNGSKRKQPKIGEKYNHLLVLRRVDNYVSPNGSEFSQWLCRCDCGNEKVVFGTSLVSGHTKSCGCLSKRPKVLDEDMIGKKFGMLTVVSRELSHKIPSGSVYDRWKCICDCGNKTISFGRQLRTGHTSSCGCQRVRNMSIATRIPKAEMWFEEYLKDNGIEYVHPKTFVGLVGVNGGLLSYDFYLPNHDYLIELNGLQHYQSVDWFGGDATFEKQQLHDMRKKEYAKQNGYCYICLDTDHISRKRFLSIIESLNL